MTDRFRILLVWSLTSLTLLAVPPAGATDEPSDDGTGTDYGRMLLVLDASGSMAEPASGGETKMEAAQRALGSVVEDLPDDAYVGLRVYGATVFSRDQPGACRDTQLVVEPGTDNRAELAAAVERFEPYGETPIAYSLRQAAKDIGSEGTRSVVLVSDGVATCEPDPCLVAAELAERGIDLQIDVVGLGVQGTARSQLRCIADRGNGTYYDADDADDIVESLDVATERALRPFALEGEPLAGGPADDPTPVDVGRYVDEIGGTSATSERWFAVDRTMPGSTIHAGVASLGRTSGTGFDTIKIEAQTPDGDYCGASAGLKQVVSGQLLGVALPVGSGQTSNEGCTDADQVLLKVSRNLGALEGVTPFSLTVVEEPGVAEADVAGLPEGLSPFDTAFEPPEVGGDPQEVLGGSSFGTATEVSDGIHRGTVLPGEAQAFRVPVTYGQTLSVRLRTPPASRRLRDLVGVQGPFAALRVFSPMRAELSTAGDGNTASGFATQASSGVLTLQTPEVRYRNRDGSIAPGYLAGDYYVVVATDEDYDGRTYEMPFTLEVQVRGEESGAPAYAEGEELRAGDGLVSAEVATEDPTGEPTDEEPTADPGTRDTTTTAGSEGATRGGASGLQLGLVGVLVAVAIACVAVAVRLLRPRG